MEETDRDIVNIEMKGPTTITYGNDSGLRISSGSIRIHITGPITIVNASQGNPTRVHPQPQALVPDHFAYQAPVWPNASQGNPTGVHPQALVPPDHFTEIGSARPPLSPLKSFSLLLSPLLVTLSPSPSHSQGLLGFVPAPLSPPLLPPSSHRALGFGTTPLNPPLIPPLHPCGLGFAPTPLSTLPLLVFGGVFLGQSLNPNIGLSLTSIGPHENLPAPPLPSEVADHITFSPFVGDDFIDEAINDNFWDNDIPAPAAIHAITARIRSVMGETGSSRSQISCMC